MLLAGQVHILGDDAWSLGVEAKSRIGYVAQDVRFFPWLKVEQLLAYTAAFYSTWNQTWVDQLVDRWSIDRRDRVGLLSPGQLQKLAIVLALGHQPELLLTTNPYLVRSRRPWRTCD